MAMHTVIIPTIYRPLRPIIFQYICKIIFIELIMIRKTSGKDNFIELRTIVARNLPNRIKMGEDAMQAHARDTGHGPKSHVKYHAYCFEDYQIDSV